MYRDDVLQAKPLSIEKLRIHFRDVYKLNESQVETMVQSSSKSLVFAMDTIDDFLRKKECGEGLGPVFHNLKGVLLNMGEEEWAHYFRTIERRIAADEKCDMSKVQKIMKSGLQDVLSYG